MSAVSREGSREPHAPRGRTPAELTHHPAAASGSPNDPHGHPAGVVLEGLETTRAGLASGEVDRRHAHFGPNSLPEPSPTHPVLRFLAAWWRV